MRPMVWTLIIAKLARLIPASRPKVTFADPASPRIHAAASRRPLRLLRRQRLEYAATALVLAIQGGAVLQLASIGADGNLNEGARGWLRLLSLLGYLIAAGLLIPYRHRLLRVIGSNLPLLFLVFLSFTSVLWSVGPSITLRRAIGLAGSLLISYFIAMRFSPRSFRDLLAVLLTFFMLASLILAALAPRLAYMPMDHVLRGVFLSKNSLGWAAGFGAVLALTLLAEQRRSALSWLLLASSLACIALSGSMTGTLALAMGIVLMLFFRQLTRASPMGRAVLLLVFAQILVFGLLLLSFFLVPALEALGKDATLTGRLPLWALVDQAIAARPILGYGYEAFWTEGNDKVWAIWQQIQWNAPHSHMGYREILLGLGLPGALGLLALLGQGLRQGFWLLLHRPQEAWLWPNLFLGMFLSMNITESLFLSSSDLPFTLTATALLMFSVQARRSGLR